MNLPLFPESQAIKDLWWHRVFKDVSLIIFVITAILSVLIVQNYYSKTREIERVKAIAEKIELRTILKRKPGKTKLYLQEFGYEVKDQYPEFTDYSNKDLALAVLYNYPQYREYTYFPNAYFITNILYVQLIPLYLLASYLIPNLAYRIFLYSKLGSNWKD